MSGKSRNSRIKKQQQQQQADAPSSSASTTPIVARFVASFPSFCLFVCFFFLSLSFSLTSFLYSRTAIPPLAPTTATTASSSSTTTTISTKMTKTSSSSPNSTTATSSFLSTIASISPRHVFSSSPLHFLSASSPPKPQNVGVCCCLPRHVSPQAPLTDHSRLSVQFSPQGHADLVNAALSSEEVRDVQVAASQLYAVCHPL